ncbi:DUF4911 domain-containing protein [Desulfofustis glycolicus]|uniref:DUF4911 domain-containing protein n=1 Tax=Desulfofustis glycolicus DSM 9705 TaxID=1121409 RepID=A0A1M5U9M0_9BACT|nr:DUF4911 domain-containing protein [Desulfofustis glycolicus]MCB2214573.1 DUF4911 domain-containing protein [Desulfobulbaceae bacterium]SHH59620.1 protein of unknown function [Desulfofustis glycolicus DSM 9705]
MTVFQEKRLTETFFRIEPRQFHLVKFILEGYDNLAVLSSLSSTSGLIRLRCAEESLPDLIGLLTALAPTIKRNRLV